MTELQVFEKRGRVFSMLAPHPRVSQGGGGNRDSRKLYPMSLDQTAASATSTLDLARPVRSFLGAPNFQQMTGRKNLVSKSPFLVAIASLMAIKSQVHET